MNSECIAAGLLIFTLTACDKHANTQVTTDGAKPAVQPTSSVKKPDEKIEPKAQQPELVEADFKWSGDFDMHVSLPKSFVSKVSDDLNPSIIEPKTPLVPTGSVRSLEIDGVGDIALKDHDFKDGYVQTTKFGALQFKVLALNIDTHHMRWKIYASPAQIAELTKFVNEASTKK